ncbi:hypothetical protein V6N13_060719 [Hibiscus sabdariffa]|uniref:Uncharacterized protein n=1 Tax=Hibiscus sabdariffa TaxID=183260 RepID=A0ABR2P7E7_9ROSI
MVGVPEWLSGMTRNHVGSARAESFYRKKKKKNSKKKRNPEKVTKGKKMRPMPVELVAEQDDQGSAMEVDDVEQLEICGESASSLENKLSDADFFNNFDDDFDDTDIN